MKKITLKKLKAVDSIEGLQSLGIGNVVADVSYRGGGVGFYGSDVCKAFKIKEGHYLPAKFGAYCNYLGGGIRGAIGVSGFANAITGTKAELLNELQEACRRAYQTAEDEMGYNQDIDDRGEINWDARGTKASRDAGIMSAY